MIQGERSDNLYPNNQKLKDIVNRLNDNNDNIKENFIFIFIILIFTEKIHGFKVKDLIRFIISNEDILNKIKDTYKKLYNNKLVDDIKNNTDDNFQIGLSILIGK